MPQVIEVSVTGTSLTGRTPAAKSFRLGSPVEVELQWSLQGRRALFVTFASSAALRGPDSATEIWSAGSGSSGSSGSRRLQLRPGGYTAFVSADKGVSATLRVIVPDPPPPPAAPAGGPSTAVTVAATGPAGAQPTWVQWGVPIGAAVVLLLVVWAWRRR